MSKVTGAQISGIDVNRRNHSTNIVNSNAKIQSGWAYGTPGVASTINLSITFPVAFTVAPIVTATFGGDTAGATSTYGSGNANVKNAYAEAISITTTGFTIRVVTGDASNWAAGNTVYAQWIAVGV